VSVSLRVVAGPVPPRLSARRAEPKGLHTLTAPVPGCAQILNQLQAPFTAVNILEDERLRSGLKEYSQWPTFPQVSAYSSNNG